jgi:hypothetical protein
MTVIESQKERATTVRQECTLENETDRQHPKTKKQTF